MSKTSEELFNDWNSISYNMKYFVILLLSLSIATPVMLEQAYSETDDFRFTELDESYSLGDEILIKFEKITKQPCPSYEVSMMKVGFPDSVMNYGVEPLCATLGPVNPYLFSEEFEKSEFFDSVGIYLIKVKLDDETIQKEIKITDNRLMENKFDSSFSINQKQVRYVIPYQISSGTVQDMQLDCDPPTLTVSISSTDSGILEMEMPNPMMRSIFSVLVDDQEWDDVSIDGNTLTVIFPKFSNIIQINSGYLLTHDKNRDGACDVAHDPPHSFIISPLKQFDSGISLDEIQCKEGLIKVIKNLNESPACVKPETISKLIEREWISEEQYAQQIIERLKQKPQTIDALDVQYIESLALQDPVVSNFVKNTDWESQCCNYSARNNVDELTIRFLDITDEKHLRVIFSLDTLEIIDITNDRHVRLGVGL